MEIARERFLDESRQYHLSLTLRSRTTEMHSVLTALSHDERDTETSYLAWKNFQTARLHDRDQVRTVAMWAPEEAVVSQSVFQAVSTVTFRVRDFLRRDTRSLALVLASRQRTLRFVWLFDPTEIRHARAALR